MRQISIATYTVEIGKKHSRKRERIDAFNGTIDVLDVFGLFLQQSRAPLNDAESKTLLKVRDHASENRNVTGIIETGEYGYTSDLLDVGTHQTVFHRETDQAGMLPFFFQLFLPSHRTEGLLALQRFGNWGIREIFATHFKKFFQDRYPEYSIRFNPIVHPDQLGLLTHDGVVRRIIFRKHSLPRDLANRLGNATAKNAYVEYAIVAKRNSDLPALRRMLRNLTRPSGRPLIIDNPGNFREDQVLLEVVLNGKVRTLNVNDLSKIRAYFDVSDEVTEGDDGHPTLDSIREASAEVVNAVWAAMEGPANV